MGVLDRGESLALLRKLAPRLDDLSAEDLSPIAERLSDLPLAAYNVSGEYAMIKAAAAETTLIDGYESSYGYTTEEQFLKGYNIAINKGRIFCPYKNKFGTHWRTAFAIMLDYFLIC